MALSKVDLEFDLAKVDLERSVVMQGQCVTKLVAINLELVSRLDALADLARVLPDEDENSDDFFNAAELAREMNAVLVPALAELLGEVTVLRA